MKILIYISVFIVVIGIIIAILAYIGLKAKKQEQKWIDEYNTKSIEVFKKAQENKKYKRAKTPKVPTINL